MPVTAYIEWARECVELADRATSIEDRKKLLVIAQAWADLAKPEAARATGVPDTKPK